MMNRMFGLLPAAGFAAAAVGAAAAGAAGLVAAGACAGAGAGAGAGFGAGVCDDAQDEPAMEARMTSDRRANRFVITVDTSGGSVSGGLGRGAGSYVCGVAKSNSESRRGIGSHMAGRTCARRVPCRRLMRSSRADDAAILTMVSGVEALHFVSKAKMVFQSSFMLMTVHFCALASAMSASLNVPIFDSGP